MISLMEVSSNTAAPVEKSEKSKFADLQTLIFSVAKTDRPNRLHFIPILWPSARYTAPLRACTSHSPTPPTTSAPSLHPWSFPSFTSAQPGNLRIPAWATSEDVHIRWTDWTFHIFCQASTCNTSDVGYHMAKAYFFKKSYDILWPRLTRYDMTVNELNISLWHPQVLQPRQAHSTNELMNEIYINIYKLHAAVSLSWCFLENWWQFFVTPVAQKQLESQVHQ